MPAIMMESGDNDPSICQFTQYIEEAPYQLTMTPILTLSKDTSRELMHYLDQLVPINRTDALYWIRVTFIHGYTLTKIGRSNNVVRRLGYDYFNTEQYSGYIDHIDLYGVFYAGNIKEQERAWLDLTREYEIKPLYEIYGINTLEYREDFMNNYEMQQMLWAFCQGLQSIVKCIVGVGS